MLMDKPCLCHLKFVIVVTKERKCLDTISKFKFNNFICCQIIVVGGTMASQICVIKTLLSKFNLYCELYPESYQVCT